MKEILVQYAAYNLWANNRISDAILQLPEEKQQEKIISSFPSIELTLLHLMNVEYIWWQRMKLVENIHIVEASSLTMHQISQKLLDASLQWKEWVDKSITAAFEHEFVYRNSKKEQFKQPVFQMLLHLFNHQTYHRGQIVTMLKQVGVDKIPPTDFIEWSRGKK